VLGRGLGRWLAPDVLSSSAANYLHVEVTNRGTLDAEATVQIHRVIRNGARYDVTHLGDTPAVMVAGGASAILTFDLAAHAFSFGEDVLFLAVAGHPTLAPHPTPPANVDHVDQIRTWLLENSRSASRWFTVAI
jgi:hypothetical protein